MKHRTSKSHYEKYAALYAVAPGEFKQMAMSILRGLCDTGTVVLGQRLEYLQRAYKYDPLLNNTFRSGNAVTPESSTWTLMSRSHFANYDWHFKETQKLTRHHRPEGGWSYADNICLLKHAMIYGILECEPDFTPQPRLMWLNGVYGMHVPPEDL